MYHKLTYEWGYALSEPMAVAPINKVEQVVRFATSVIPPEKIFMGIPNYGYDWPLPYIKGQTRARSLGNVQAVEQAIQDSVNGKFSSTPYVGTLANGGVSIAPFHDFDDKVSAELKADLTKLTDDIKSGKLVIESQNAPK